MISEKFINDLRAKNKNAIARSISLIELDNIKSENLISNIFKFTGNSYRIGITGPPGAGKSTITNQLTKYLRNKNKSVGIIAVDPTSPFSGGALLGDRVRMNDIAIDDNVFIRSMAARGSLGGLSKKAIDAADIFDAAGFDYIIFETVGVGQSELDIVKASDTTIVIIVPESGDSVQAMKAGLMEIADIFVVNKSDRPGSEQAVNSLKTILMLKEHNELTWLPKILKAVATENKGISNIAEEIENHKNFLIEKNFFNGNRDKKLKNRIKEIVESKLLEELWQSEHQYSIFQNLDKIKLNYVSPYQIAKEILQKFKTKIIERK